MDCYVCDQEATQRCPRCGNPYCRDHGEDLCADCLNPVNAAPSGTFFRVSLLVLLLGSVFALWLLIRPPGLPGESSEVIVPQASPVASPELITPSPMPSPVTPVAGATAEPTPELTPTPTPEPTQEPEGPIEYTVEEGDTLFGIAEFFGVSFEDILAVNGLAEEDAQFIQPGDVLAIPQY
jgi:LysM repeat protein